MEVTYLDIKKANESIKTTKIKGKDYAEVNQRIKAFRMVYPTGTISTDLISNENGICIFKATVGYRQSENEVVILATGTAYEKEGSSFINDTSYIENCETSAIGRALGIAGFGVDIAIASAEELTNAITQQDDNLDKIIDKRLKSGIDLAIDRKKIDDETILKVLSKYGYSSTAEIKNKDYMTIVKEFREMKG